MCSQKLAKHHSYYRKELAWVCHSYLKALDDLKWNTFTRVSFHFHPKLTCLSKPLERKVHRWCCISRSQTSLWWAHQATKYQSSCRWRPVGGWKSQQVLGLNSYNGCCNMQCCNTCLLLEKLHQVPRTARCVCVCACSERNRKKSRHTAMNAFKKNKAYTLPRDSTGLRISPTTSMFFKDNIKAFLASSRLLPWAKMWPNWESAYSWMPPLAPMLK